MENESPMQLTTPLLRMPTQKVTTPQQKTPPAPQPPAPPTVKTPAPSPFQGSVKYPPEVDWMSKLRKGFTIPDLPSGNAKISPQYELRDLLPSRKLDPDRGILSQLRERYTEIPLPQAPPPRLIEKP
jgi:hypothetical protein